MPQYKLYLRSGQIVTVDADWLKISAMRDKISWLDAQEGKVSLISIDPAQVDAIICINDATPGGEQ